MRRLLRIICLFRGHRMVPYPCCLCAMDRSGECKCYRCLICHARIELEHNVIVEWVDDDKWRVDDNEPYLHPLEEVPHA